MDHRHMARVRGQIGHCGIWCGSCAVGTGALMELARRYREMAESHGVEHWGASAFDYAEFAKGLECISRLDVCPGCLLGGGRDDCELRICSAGRGVESCPECDSFGDCPHGELLEHMRSGAGRAGMAVVDSPADSGRILSQPDAELAGKWWWRALFAGEE
jgi:hypothetical protein